MGGSYQSSSTLQNIHQFVMFQVANVELAQEPLEKVAYQEAITACIERTSLHTLQLESCSLHEQSLVACSFHPLVATIYQAFRDHRPLVLSPDHIWLLICQGFAQHVRTNAEQLRHKFVNVRGRQPLNIERDDFVKGRLENPWEEVFPELCDQIHERIGDTHNLVAANFSTTGMTEQAAFEITLVDTVQSYFSSSITTCCGIPTITLEGTTRDWQSVLDRAQAVREFDLDWWIGPLTPILEQFVQASRGKVDHAFWESIYKWRSPGSSEAQIQGWITKFFPYLGDTARQNPCVYSDYGRAFMTTRLFPSGVSKCPFIWRCYHEMYPMGFLAGFIGATQDHDTLSLRPEIGWAVVDTEPTANR